MARIALLHSDLGEGPTPDQQESLDIAFVVQSELQKLGHEVIMAPFTLDLAANIAALRQIAPDLVFNMVDDIAADDSLHYIAASLLQHLGLKFTGSTPDQLFATSNKLITKRLLTASGVPTPDWVSLDDERNFVPGVPYILKPVNHDASIGIHGDAVCTPGSLEDLRENLRACKQKTGWDFFSERYIAGREFWVSLFGPWETVQVFPPAEMKFYGYQPGDVIPEFVTYRAKWERESFEYHHLGATYTFDPVEARLINSIRQIARSAWQALYLRGYGRIDFRVDQNGQPWLLDINLNPYLPFHPGGILDAVQQEGWDFSRLLDEILKLP